MTDTRRGSERTLRPQCCEPGVSPEEDEASASSLALAPAIAVLAREVRERHMAERRAETETATISKVRKWKDGTTTPQGGRHK